MVDSASSSLTHVPAVARRALDRFGEALHGRALAITTRLPSRVPLRSLSLSPELREFVLRREPDVEHAGLFAHQAELIERAAQEPEADFLLTSGTASGKSLAFWAWVAGHLVDTPASTALVCFPTQALMWSQAERLARGSSSRSLEIHDTVPFAGTISVGRRRIGWTVWKGVGSGATQDWEMLMHEQSPRFARARIRVATLDKAHFSLLRDVSFLRRLRCVVLDEAHIYGGVLGANVCFFLRRLCLARELLGLDRPRFLLSSATLGNPREFATDLLSRKDERPLIHVSGQAPNETRAVEPEACLELLQKPPEDALVRAVLLFDRQRAPVDFAPFFAAPSGLGETLNAIYFVEAKHRSKELARAFRAAAPSGERRVELYDGDIPPGRRREIERILNSAEVCGTTLLATSALELGVDIESLDVCAIETCPSTRHELLQRIGRVGRRLGRPGLALVAVSVNPADRALLEHVDTASGLDAIQPQPLPLDVDVIRWRHMYAAYCEGLYEEHAKGDGRAFARSMLRYFGEVVSREKLRERFREAFGDDVPIDDHWAHRGFRGTASEGTIPLVEFGGHVDGRPVPREGPKGRRDIAWIDSACLFRDAHPEGVFLGHEGERWRVIAYGQRPPRRRRRGGRSGGGLDMVFVERIPEPVVTRGEWDDSWTLVEAARQPPSGLTLPAGGNLTLGRWRFERRWKGYTIVNLDSDETRFVSVGEVSQRFRQAIQQGEAFPFLRPLIWPTLGWEWLLPDESRLRRLQAMEAGAVEALLAKFFSSRLDCNASDLILVFRPSRGALVVLDASPGGSGLSYTLLRGRIPEALDSCVAALRALDGPSRQSDFNRYVGRLSNVPCAARFEAVVDAIETLRRPWNAPE